MAITTRLQPKYSIRMVIIALVSIVLGIWGVLDFFFWIPAKETAFQRGRVCLAVKDALQAAGEDPGSAEARGKIDEAQAVVGSQLQELWNLGFEASEPEEPASASEDELSPEEAIEATKERFSQAIERIREQNQESWLGLMMLFQSALTEAGRMQPGRSPSSTFAAAYELARQGVDETGNVSEPAAYDRYVKGLLFIPCVPFGLYLFWPLYRRSRQRYGLEDDGTFFAPQGRWPKEEIADIDMSRWMSKSIAYVELKDGSRVKLDDYIFRDVHLIVGALASERYPEQWDEQAKPIKKGQAEADDSDEAEEGDGETGGPTDTEPEAEADEEKAEAAG
jgi:hypothetical protein